MTVTPLTVVLIIIGTVLPVSGIVIGICALWYYGAEEDYGYDSAEELSKNAIADRAIKVFRYAKTATLPKIVFVLSFTLVVLSVFLAPLDIANMRFRAGLDFTLGIVWQVFYGIVCIFILVIVPYMIFYYEAEDPDNEGIKGILQQSKWAVIFTACILCFSLVAVGASYYWFSMVHIPYMSHVQASYYTVKPTGNYLPVVESPTSVVKQYRYASEQFELRISIVIYFVCLVSLLGYFVFVTCGGCGLTSLPISCFKAFWDNKPSKILHASDFEKHKNKAKQDTETLLQIGTELQNLQDEGKLGPKHIKIFQEFRHSVLKLEDSWNTYYKRFRPAKNLGDAKNKTLAFANSFILPFFYLIYGVIAMIISLIWIAHIIIYLGIEPIPHAGGWSWGFLNIIFYYLDYITFQIPIPGVLLYSIFTFHLMFCVVSGVSFVASKIPLFAVHPLRMHDTMMSSLLFNVGLFLLASVTVNQFSITAFSQYTAGTQLETMFGTAMRNMFVVKYFFIASIYIFLVFAVIGLFISTILFFCGAKPKEAKDLAAAAKNLGIKL